MSRLTIFLARAIGLFTVVLVAALLVRGSAIIEASVADGPVMLFYATINLAMGIAMVLGHNVWTGVVLPVAEPRKRRCIHNARKTIEAGEF